MRSTLLFLTCAMLSESAAAQPISLLTPGTSVRVTTRADHPQRITGGIAHVIAAGAESLEVRLEDHDSHSAFGWADITRLDVRRAVPMTERVRAGAAVGGLIGAVAGAVAGSGKESQGFQIFDPTLEGAAMGAAYGILAGGLVGALMSATRWEQVWPIAGSRPAAPRGRSLPSVMRPTFSGRTTPTGFGRTPSFARP